MSVLAAAAQSSQDFTWPDVAFCAVIFAFLGLLCWLACR